MEDFPGYCPDVEQCPDCTRTYRHSYWGKWRNYRCPTCQRSKCPHPPIVQVYGHIVKSDGVKDGRRWCGICGLMRGGVKKQDMGKICFRDYLADHPHVCERCGKRGTQTHHWAPSAIFGWEESSKWPTAELCPTCHSRWHVLMRKAKGFSMRDEAK